MLKTEFGADNLRIVRTEAVGPRVGEELKRGAIIAMLLSFLITLVYLAIRFEWRFGAAALIATATTSSTTLAFLKLMHLEISLTVVAGLLTVLGYSLNDTIIIFDRVRENLRKGRKESLYETLNRSINETLPRSILTHATALAATLALLFFAGEVIQTVRLGDGVRNLHRNVQLDLRSSAGAPLDRTQMAAQDGGRAQIFIDSHAHLADPAFAGDRDAVIARARDAGAAAIVCIGGSRWRPAALARLSTRRSIRALSFRRRESILTTPPAFDAQRDIPKLRALTALRRRRGRRVRPRLPLRQLAA